MATFGLGTIGFFRTLEEKSPNARSAQLHQGAVKFGIVLVVLGIAATVLSGASQWFSLGGCALNLPKMKGLPVEIRKPLKTNNKLVAGVRFELTTFGL